MEYPGISFILAAFTNLFLLFFPPPAWDLCPLNVTSLLGRVPLSGCAYWDEAVTGSRRPNEQGSAVQFSLRTVCQNQTAASVFLLISLFWLIHEWRWWARPEGQWCFYQLESENSLSGAFVDDYLALSESGVLCCEQNQIIYSLVFFKQPEHFQKGFFYITLNGFNGFIPVRFFLWTQFFLNPF